MNKSSISLSNTNQNEATTSKEKQTVKASKKQEPVSQTGDQEKTNQIIAETIQRVRDTRYVVFFDCFNSNPRGNFEDGNRPTVFSVEKKVGDRMVPEEFAEVTPVCLKRGIRTFVLNQYAGKPGMDIFVQERRFLDSVIATMPGNDLAAEMCAAFYDVRAFGGVLIGECANNEDAEDGASEESGLIHDQGKTAARPSKIGKVKKSEKKTSKQVLGPVVVDFATSIDPVEIVDRKITRVCAQNDKAGEHNVGTVSFLRYARLRFGVYIEGFQAAKTGFSPSDQEVLERGLMDLYRYRRSAGRPNIRTRAVYKITAKTPEVNTLAMDKAMDALQCAKAEGVNPENLKPENLKPDSYVLPEPFENEFVTITRIK